MTAQQEIALGQQSAPRLVDELGGMSSDNSAQQLVDDIGNRIVNNSVAAQTPWEFEFHVLDADMVNALALPGGQIFITDALLSRLDREEIAGVLAHEIVHVLARHSAQRMAKSELTNGLVGAVAVASGEAGAAQTAAVVGQLINMQYGREDEIQSDTLGVCLMIDAGYDPSGMREVMQVLAEASEGARPPEFFSTHPDPGNRIERINETIDNAGSFCEQNLNPQE
jgi:predicted Zn-dependent protease